MNKLKYLLVIIVYVSSIVLISCNTTTQEENIHKETVEKYLTTINEIETSSDNELEINKSFVNTLFENKINAQTDYIIKEKLVTYKATVDKAISYLDILINEINSLDKYSQGSIDYIKNKFLDKGVADSIFDLSKNCFELSGHLVKNSSSKAKIKQIRQDILNEPETQITKNAYFGVSSPLQVKTILIAFENEILNSARIVLNDL